MKTKLCSLTTRLLTLFAFAYLLSVGRGLAQVYEEVFSFGDARAEDFANGPHKGRAPSAALLQAADGNFYGTLRYGTVFKMTADGVLTTVVEFTGTSGSYKGSEPNAVMVRGSNGNLYGTTSRGGAANFGTVFTMTATGVLTTLVEFTSGNNLGNVDHFVGLVQGSDGNFYGTTSDGGAFGYGTVFKMTATGVLTTLVEFTHNGATNRGSKPLAGLVEGSDGNFYGTTSEGGPLPFGSGDGTVFKVTPAGVLTTLVDFTFFNGKNPKAGLLRGSDGNFYGTTHDGSDSAYSDNGTIFKVTADGVLTTLAVFTDNGANNKGKFPSAGLALGSDGNLYGTTEVGGAFGQGTAFMMTPDGQLTTLVEFSGNGTSNKGARPKADLALGSDGNFYGTASEGGAFGYGTVFKLTPAGVLTTLAEFSAEGTSIKPSTPYASLVQGSDGDFYGTTREGGPFYDGTVFKMTAGGDVTTLVEFAPQGMSNRGEYPVAPLVQGSAGDFYGTTPRGAAFGGGTVFKITAGGEFTTLVEFTGNGATNKGRNSVAGLVQGSDGDFYGSTSNGGALDAGTIFKMTPTGLLTTLVEFTGNGTINKGSNPRAALVQASNGNFYGTTAAGGASGYGTVFQMTPSGNLTTLVEFTRDGMLNRGSNPRAGLVLGSDGDFYGTTYGGGALGQGTVFKMTAGGVLTTLVEFTGSGQSGTRPDAGLVHGSDGNFYGTTLLGGRTGTGTVFKMTAAGVLTTLVEFNAQEEGYPEAALIRGADGNLYGTTSGSDGIVYRLIFPGVPLVASFQATLQGSVSAVVEAKVNARGATTAVLFEYGTNGADFPNTVPVVINLTGFQTKRVGTTLDALTSGTTYFYRFRAVSSAGTTISPVASFSTLAEPVVTTVAATGLTIGSAQLNGTVNARNYASTVSFEWSENGSSFPNRIPSVPGTVTGNAEVAVSAQIAGLVKNRTYYFRIVATNAAGAVVTGARSFTTLVEPLASVGGAFGLGTTSASVAGSVDGRGSVAGVVFEYGTNGVSFPSSVAATPASVAGAGAVSAVLTNLSQGTTYYFRIRATSAGGVGLSAVGTFDLGVLSGFTQVAPGPVDPRGGAAGFLVVNLTPAGVVGLGWRFVGEQEWRLGGVPAGGLATGNREIEFRPVPGYLHPLREPVSVVSGAAATVVEREYFSGGGVAAGSLGVTLLPASLGAGAQWRLLGEGDSAWRASGASLGGLAAGVYLVECKEVNGYATPRPLSVTIGSGEAKTATATYFLADAPVGAQPGVVGFDAVTSATANPFTYVGQLRNDSGAGTGFVVRQRVVATAAHVVFDDGTLSAATGLQWLFQRERGTYEPVPQVPRGSYILSGYSAQRIADGTPGVSSAAAQNLDVAAVWFYEQDAGRGGSGGYLASDSTDNEWLLSPRLKTLVGYPLDDIAAQNQGRLHATPPANVPFTHAAARVYLTDGITSRGGNSGGPVCVQYDDGRYFPAAIYLGGSTQTRVRVIDRDVITLFDSAEESSTTGQNSTNGGASQTNASLAAPASGTLTVTIQPASARLAGAGWRIGSGTYLASGQSKPYLSAGTYSVAFKTIEGFEPLATHNVKITGGSTTRITVDYAPIGSVPAPAAVPTYVGLLTGPAGSSGLATLGITSGGRFTMTLRLDGEKLRLLGKFAADGTFTGTLPRPGKTAANITLSFDRVLVPQLTGTITIDSTPFTLAGGRSPFGAKNPAPTAGTHTLLLPRDPTQNDPALYPAGSGYALLAVSRSGKLQAIGRLGDHTAFALSTPVFADGTAPLFLQPYAKRGLLAGTLTFLSDSDEISGTLRWQKPATSKGRYPTGFSGTTAVLGSRWTPPARGSAALDITGWHFNIGTTSLTTSLDVHNRFTLAPADIAKLKLTASTGLLTGTYKPTPTAKPTPFTGALLQRQRLGRGLFLTPTQSTPFELKEN